MPAPFKKHQTLSRPTPHGVAPGPLTSHVAVANPGSRIITTSGQVGTLPDGKVPKSNAEQVARAYYNLKQCLDTAGARVEDIMHLTHYLAGRDQETKEAFGRSLYMFLEGNNVPQTLVPVPGLAEPEYLYEIQAMAAIPQEPLREVDVVVVGAGLSGLRAAMDVQKAGFSVAVVEARDRIGGKTLSLDSSTGKCDMGGTWFNDTNQSFISEMIKKYSLKTIITETSGNVVLEDRNGNLSSVPYGTSTEDPETAPMLESFLYNVRPTCWTVDVNSLSKSSEGVRDFDKVTFADLVAAQAADKSKVPAGVERASLTTATLLGLEPAELSAWYMLSYGKTAHGFIVLGSDARGGAQYMRMATGTQTFSSCMANELPNNSIQLSSPVSKIKQMDDGVLVEAARGNYKCKRVIVSVPTTLYKEIQFQPPLPHAKEQYAKNTILGYYTKWIAVYRKPWWKEAGLNGLVQCRATPFVVARDSSNDAVGHYSMTVFLVGQAGRDWAKNPKAVRDKQILDRLDELFGKYAKVEQPIEIYEQDWMNEHWSQGGPCPATTPGIWTKYGDSLLTPHDRVHFVGTETAEKWRGYMEGAIRSGARGASEVVHKLSSSRL